ncbi:hypothetical protein QJS10_CPA16g01212 [Acorus calamus]|uniref:Uncharacterized protein n=1 Tax=Acorus calamus TaxID=4465 RepID=A0AAV9D0N7_ACOCL|nr:hypothetical protein QJS10_CPA16g01212 [Acorus calamus]
MLRLLCKNLSQIRPFSVSTTPPPSLNGAHSRFPQNPGLKSITHIANRSKEEDPSRTTVSYLVNSCGLSSESALKASKRFRIISLENADSVLSLFKNRGFDQTQLDQMITRYPHLLTYDPDKILKPKMEFLKCQVGFSAVKLNELVSLNPQFFNGSLEKRIKPSFDLLKDIVGTNENALLAITRLPSILSLDLRKKMLPKVALLREHGVPVSNISKLITRYSRIITVSDDRFSEVVAELKKMGFVPFRPLYLTALRTMSGMSNSNWERKFEVFKCLGLSEDEILEFFKKFPYCMILSETKMRKGFEFFMKRLGWDPYMILRYPNLIGLSLEKRMLPRYEVMQTLLSNGLVEKDVNWGTIFKLKEKDFLKKFVIKYQGGSSKVKEMRI